MKKMTTSTATDKQKEKRYRLLTPITLLLALLPIAAIPLVNGNARLLKLISLVSLTLMALFLYFNLKWMQSAYEKAQYQHAPILVLRKKGFGITVNPFHPLGKIIWYGLIIALILLVIRMRMGSEHS